MTDTPTLTDYLPNWLGDFVTETAQELQVPANAVSVLALGAVAAAVNGGAQSSPTTTWSEPVALYTLALLASGEGKSPVFTRLFDPVLDASDMVTDNQQGDLNQQKARNRMNKKFLRKYETKQMALVEKGEIDLDEAVVNVATEERRLRAHRITNVVPIRVLTDASPAAVIDAMEANDGRLVVASPEAEALLNFRGGSKEAILKGFDGETLTQARRTTGEVTIDRPVVNMVLAMQPTVLGSLGQDMVNRGLMPRFLMAYPETLVGRRQARPMLVSIETRDAYGEAVSDIVTRFAKPNIVTIAWDRAALKEIGTWRLEIEPMLAQDGALASIGAWGSKIRGAHFIRLAALLTIMDGGTTVSVEHARKAKGICRILIDDAVRAFGEMGASFADDDLVHLLGVVKTLTGQFSKRDVMRKSNRFMSNPARGQDAIDRAVAEGFLRKVGRGWEAV